MSFFSGNRSPKPVVDEIANVVASERYNQFVERVDSLLLFSDDTDSDLLRVMLRIEAGLSGMGLYTSYSAMQRYKYCLSKMDAREVIENYLAYRNELLGCDLEDFWSSFVVGNLALFQRYSAATPLVDYILNISDVSIQAKAMLSCIVDPIYFQTMELSTHDRDMYAIEALRAVDFEATTEFHFSILINHGYVEKARERIEYASDRMQLMIIEAHANMLMGDVTKTRMERVQMLEDYDYREFAKRLIESSSYDDVSIDRRKTFYLHNEMYVALFNEHYRDRQFRLMAELVAGPSSRVAFGDVPYHSELVEYMRACGEYSDKAIRNYEQYSIKSLARQDYKSLVDELSLEKYHLGYVGTHRLAKIQASPINIVFTAQKDGKKIGQFTEEDGVLSFEGDVSESADAFVDYVCKSFNARIEELVKGNRND